jgi:hypothetical protein
VPAVVLAVVVAATACGDQGSVACGPVTREAIDPASGLHVLPGQPVPDFTTDPPTSGAHYSLPPPSGALDAPVDEPMQVTLLESGAVLVQHRDLPAAEVAELNELAGPEVVVAPNPDLPEPVVLTAWRTRQACAGAAVADARAFIADHRGTGPGTDF